MLSLDHDPRILRCLRLSDTTAKGPLGPVQEDSDVLAVCAELPGDILARNFIHQAQLNDPALHFVQCDDAAKG